MCANFLTRINLLTH